MTVAAPPDFAFDNTYVRELEGLYVPWKPSPASAPRLLVLNDALAAELGLDPVALRAPGGIDVLAGNVVPDGAASVAQAYSGHQFGGFSPRLGDGRALLLGEVVDVHGRRRDLHFKGSGPTPFARGGDGKAAVGPMLREYVLGEAMHALGIPTTRALAVVATGDDVVRETLLPGAVLTRVAASHLRVGTFEYAAAHGDQALLRRLADYAIARHHPRAAEAADPHLALYECVVEAQAALVAQWLLAGFIHGVMNTDNMTISGETIDYGPCAFMEAFDPATVFSSIDHAGRYAYGNQALVAQWNLARLAEAMLPLFDADLNRAIERATASLDRFPGLFEQHWLSGMRSKLGLFTEEPDDKALADDLLAWMRRATADFTNTFRSLTAGCVPERAQADGDFDVWHRRLEARRLRQPQSRGEAEELMRRHNAAVIPRNHKVEEALLAATRQDDLSVMNRLLEVLSRPYDHDRDEPAFTAPGDGGRPYQTFCGT